MVGGGQTCGTSVSILVCNVNEVPGQTRLEMSQPCRHEGAQGDGGLDGAGAEGRGVSGDSGGGCGGGGGGGGGGGRVHPSSSKHIRLNIIKFFQP